MAEDKRIYFEQYKLYIDGIEKISDRRGSANRYFITLNSSIFVLAGLIIQYTNENQKIFLVGLCGLALAVSVIFFLLINAYKQLNTGKFAVIHKIEGKLPLQLYTDEWEILGKGKNKKLYFPFSHIERLIPFLFFLCYLGAIIYLLFGFNKFFSIC
jgi:hypothetical protein